VIVCAGAVVLAGAIFFRFHRLHEMPPGLWWDEAQTGRVVRGILQGDFPPIYDLRINAGTVASYANAAWCLLVGTSGPWGLRSYTACIGVLTVLASWWFFRQLFHPGWSLFGVALLASSRWLFTINRTAMATIDETILLTVLVLTFMLKAIRHHAIWDYAITGLLTGLAMHLHTGARVLPLIIGIDILAGLWRPPPIGRNRFALRAALLILCAVIVFAPMGRYLVTHSEEYLKRSRETLLSTEYPGWVPIGPYVKNVQNYLKMYIYHGDWHPRHNHDRTPQLPPPAAVFGALGAFLAAGAWSRRRDMRLLVSGFILASLQGILTVHLDTANLNRVAVNIPIVFAWVVMGAQFMGRGIVRCVGCRWGRPVVAGVSATVVGFCSWYAYDIYFNHYLPSESLAQVYGFQPEITEMALRAQQMLDEEPELHVWAMYTRGDPFNYVFAGHPRLHDLSLIEAPGHREPYPIALIVPAHQEEMLAFIQQSFPDVSETAIPYSLNPTYTLLWLFRIDSIH
ncbi:glycosyltransferase family 39 protein, partial [bacterium]|nr:glycosyltransferase family 39 protein [candidate division CSSED10-310 bacterium]